MAYLLVEKLNDGTDVVLLDQSSPVQIPGTNWKQVACGYSHFAAAIKD
jgi:hypothetical protein